MEFLEETGLAEVFTSRKVKDLVDYVFGIETGLDTNARKNRSGKIMETTVHNILTEAGIEHRCEVYSSEWPEITSVLGDDEKRFDFVIETPSKVYLMEVNFYSGGGSKLNEVARSYSDISPKSILCQVMSLSGLRMAKVGNLQRTSCRKHSASYQGCII